MTALESFKTWIASGGSPVYDDSSGGLSCVMCSSLDPDREPESHDADCPYRLAKAELPS